MDWLAAALLAAATLVALGLLWLLKRLTPVDKPVTRTNPHEPARTIPHQRHGTIVHVRCVECGELVERHRAVLIDSGGWYCRDPEQCPPSDAR